MYNAEFHIFLMFWSKISVLKIFILFLAQRQASHMPNFVFLGAKMNTFCKKVIAFYSPKGWRSCAPFKYFTCSSINIYVYSERSLYKKCEVEGKNNFSGWLKMNKKIYATFPLQHPAIWRDHKVWERSRKYVYMCKLKKQCNEKSYSALHTCQVPLLGNAIVSEFCSECAPTPA